MAHLIPNTFCSFQLTDQEELTGTILNYLQVCVLRNKQALIAQEKLNLNFDPEHPDNFVQNEAYLKGQLSIITWLLDSSEAAESAAKLEAEISAANSDYDSSN